MTLFGTDGIRGTANQFPMTAEVALKLGMAAGTHFNRGDHRHRAVIAKDTRLSGYLLEPALTSGLIATGMDVVLVGPMPTPAVSMLVRSLRADLGIMISASHNPYHDNGLKLFGPTGEKLSDEDERTIEALMGAPERIRLAGPKELGRAKRLDDAQGRYIESAKQSFPTRLTLEGLHIVLDCAHGAAYHVGPLILSELGAKVTAIGVQPDGFNINEKCGSTAPELLRETVCTLGAHVGIALDGDADRVVMCDETGKLLDGDQMLAMIAIHWRKAGRLKGDAVVATHMSNMGLERYLQALGLQLIRTNIGDRYVAEGMRTHGCNVGGENSGHIILSDYAATGDGLIAALQALAVMIDSDQPLSACAHAFTPFPQHLRNIPYRGDSPLTRPDVKEAIESARLSLGDRGRVLVRASGTEPLIRVMVEGEDERKIVELADKLCNTVRGS